MHEKCKTFPLVNGILQVLCNTKGPFPLALPLVCYLYYTCYLYYLEFCILILAYNFSLSYSKISCQPPRPVEPWDDIMDATAEKIGCPSVVSMESLKKLDDVLDIEDCLTLTITTPNTMGRFPVLVYIHGEYLYEGSNSEAPPDYLLEKDIVLVTPQYRLGPFGFLSTKTDEIPGNAGVLDIYLALQFVKHFIQYFGGDESHVTLAGQVGGAAIAHLLSISPIVSTIFTQRRKQINNNCIFILNRYRYKKDSFTR